MKSKGFTIVELLIVVVVIGILATITIVAYNGIQGRAQAAAVSSSLIQAASKLALYYVDNNNYPATVAAVGIQNSTSATFQYTFDNSATPSYCLIATNGSALYSVTNGNVSPQSGSCNSGNLVGWWRFNGDASDASGNGYNGTLNGGTFSTGQNSLANGSYSLNGTGDYVNAAPISLAKFTVSAWVKPNGVQTGSASIVADGYPGKVNYAIYFDGGTTNVRAGIYLSGWSVTSAFTLIDSVWSHVAFTYNGSVEALYVNGILVHTTAYTVTPSSGGLSLNIGKRWDQANYFKGLIDDVRIYSNASTSSDIQAMYTAGGQ